MVLQERTYCPAQDNVISKGPQLSAPSVSASAAEVLYIMAREPAALPVDRQCPPVIHPMTHHGWGDKRFSLLSSLVGWLRFCLDSSPADFTLCPVLLFAPSFQRGLSPKCIIHSKFLLSITFWATQPMTQTVEGLDNWQKYTISNSNLNINCCSTRGHTNANVCSGKKARQRFLVLLQHFSLLFSTFALHTLKCWNIFLKEISSKGHLFLLLFQWRKEN